MMTRKHLGLMQGAALVAAMVLAGPSAFALQHEDAPEAAAVDKSKPLLTVNVTDAAGKPIADAQAYLINGTYGLPMTKAWQDADDSGALTFVAGDVDVPAKELETGTQGMLVVRAPGKAWTTVQVGLPSAQPVAVTLEEGRTLTLNITAEGDRAIPANLSPVIFADGLSVAAWRTHTSAGSDTSANSLFSAAIPTKAGKGKFTVNVPSNLENVWVFINEPGFIRAFQAGPFDAEAMKAGTLDIVVPEPVTVAINLHPAEGKPTEYSACYATVMMTPQIPDGGWAFRVVEEFSDSKELNVTLNDLPPGRFGVEGMTGTKETRFNRERDDFFSTAEWFELAAGETKDIDFAIETFDEEQTRASLKGDNSITIKVTKPDGSPAVGEEYELAFSLRQFGRNLSVETGKVPANGEIVVAGLPDGTTAALEFSVNGNYLGWIMIDPNEEKKPYEFGLPPGVGELAPDLVLTRLSDDSEFKLSDLRGKVVFLDFWASWCGPCQEPMAHNNEMMGRRTDWDGKAVILGASIDNTIDIIKDHVGKRDWNNVLQAFCSEGDPGWACDAIKKYAVTGVPTCFLIDREGKIAWTGHPASIDVEAKIDELLLK